MRAGYLILAVLYVILALVKTEWSKADFWIYIAIGLVYAGLSEAISLGFKLE